MLIAMCLLGLGSRPAPNPGHAPPPELTWLAAHPALFLACVLLLAAGNSLRQWGKLRELDVDWTAELIEATAKASPPMAGQGYRDA